MDFFSIPIFAAFVATSPAATSSPIQVEEGTKQPLTRSNSFYGPTGLISIPTAYTVRRNEARVGAAFGKNERGPSANYGLLDFIEVGGAFIDRDGLRDKAIANAKVTIVPSNFRYFELGIGVIDAADAIDQTFYFVASADLVLPRVSSPGDGSLPIGFKVHAGAGTGLFRERLFGGGELMFGNRFSVLAEYDSRNFNAALKYTPNDNLSLQLGVRDSALYFGMTSNVRF